MSFLEVKTNVTDPVFIRTPGSPFSMSGFMIFPFLRGHLAFLDLALVEIL